MGHRHNSRINIGAGVSELCVKNPLAKPPEVSSHQAIVQISQYHRRRTVQGSHLPACITFTNVCNTYKRRDPQRLATRVHSTVSLSYSDRYEASTPKTSNKYSQDVRDGRMFH
ncbi:hypothetical protein OUZ56_021702 [Daphnia magna]|uniref:Uncharacterized protein n=1 Tax=Daphnia magna TaxID=35525 RepID=A0ABR0AUA7_9CRUS|nr:hypothetical protein OUZ56_021702 [Daphnia magna]